MAIFRKIHTSFWSDSFVQDLTPEQKYFYLYLLTNEKTSQCGIYEISKRQICYDTGYNIDTVSKLLEYFIKVSKIKYSVDTNEIAIKNWDKYNKSDSPKVKVFVSQQLNSVKDKELIQYLYSNDTDSPIRIRIEEEIEKQQQTIDTDKIDEFLPKKENMVVQEMVKIFKEKNPSYFYQKETDYTACLQIAYNIADYKGWMKSQVVNEKKNDVLTAWSNIVDFISEDVWLSTRSLTDISTTKEFQRLVQKMTQSIKDKSKKEEKPKEAKIDLK